MQTNEIIRLTRQAVAELLASREAAAEPYEGHERRRVPRWPFDGAVEFRLAGGTGSPQWFGSCDNLSQTGLGASCDRHFEPGTRVEITVHQPEASLFGEATVCHCTQRGDEYYVGVDFDFDFDE